ncbi:hypothetical protein CDD81_6860 [Ophiocordyceps australis]|uniref:AA1-like domain-containing protein n=1 Tax=Ophiocordyceps australis TaxID=1399860 RepID=A0A2C5Y4L5_9HYPO|nr:hypothetical protein CDD81_6860 [Ophiocordyceps australis]
MRASTTLNLLLAGLAAAAPASEPRLNQVFDITNFSVRKDSSDRGEFIRNVNFALSGADVMELPCNADKPGPDQVVECGVNSGFGFRLHQMGNPGTSYTVSVFHDIEGAKEMGDTTVGVYCHAGGDGPNDFVCTQVAPAAVTLDHVVPAAA